MLGAVTSWADFAAAAPELAAEVARRFTAHKHLVMATLRADGSPRLNGTEVVLTAGQLWLAGMSGARRFADLRRDPRVALHSGSDDPPTWSGDARVSGRAVDATPEELAAVAAVVEQPADGSFELFRVELTEAVSVRLAEGGESLLIETWRPDQGLTRRERR